MAKDNVWITGPRPFLTPAPGKARGPSELRAGCLR